MLTAYVPEQPQDAEPHTLLKYGLTVDGMACPAVAFFPKGKRDVWLPKENQHFSLNKHVEVTRL